MSSYLERLYTIEIAPNGSLTRKGWGRKFGANTIPNPNPSLHRPCSDLLQAFDDHPLRKFMARTNTAAGLAQIDPGPPAELLSQRTTDRIKTMRADITCAAARLQWTRIQSSRRLPRQGHCTQRAKPL